MISLYVVMAFSFISAVTDLKERLIYDKVTIPALITGMVYHIIYGQGFAFAFTGMSVGAILLVLSLFTNQIGDGDAKLFIAVGAWLGWLATLFILFFAFIIAFIWFMEKSLSFWLKNKRLVIYTRFATN